MITPARENQQKAVDDMSVGTLAEKASSAGTKTGRSEPGREPTNRLVDMAYARLQSSSYHPLRHVHCTVQGRALVLSGRVSSYYLKQLAQVLLKDLVPTAGVDYVDNQIEVFPEVFPE